MPLSPPARRRGAALLPPVLAGVALLAAARASPPPVGGWAILAGIGMALAGALGALHRPSGGRTLGLGAAALAPAIVLGGPAAAGLVAAAVALLAEGGRAALDRGIGLPRPAVQVGRSFGAVGRATLTAVAAALAWRALGPGSAGVAGTGADPAAAGSMAAVARPAAAATAVYLAMALAIDGATRCLRSPGTRPWWRRALPRGRDPVPYVLDLAGWVAGAAVVAAGLAGAWGAAGVLLLLIGLAATEAARQGAMLAASERRLADFGRVRRAGERMIAPARELEAVVDRIADECANVVSCQWFQLELLSPAEPGAADGDERAVWSAGPDRKLLEEPARPDAHPPKLPGVHRRAEWRVLERPLGAQGGASARLTLWCDPRRLHPEDLELLDALLPQMAASLHQALLDREAREDPLTGAAVRRVFDRRLHVAWTAAREGGGPLALILVDVDRFKPINDTWGHATGDRALAAVAEALEAGRRESDLLARYGGEEFALLLEDTDGPAALTIAERLRRRVAEVEVEADDDRPLPLTISAGVASLPEVTVKTAGELLLLADEALYQAKERGRDRCLLHRGRGRYLTPDGVEIGDAPPGDDEPRAPRLFA